MKYLIPVALFLLLACKNMENTHSEKCKVHVTSDTLYRFQVSFISIGSGTDRNAKQKFNDFIGEFNNANQVNIVPEIVNWGREGEVDYCFKLLGIDSSMQIKFISESNLIFIGNTLVKCFENMPCKHKSKQ